MKWECWLASIPSSPTACCRAFLSALTIGEEGLWSITISGSLLRSFLSCSWCSRAKPAAMSLGTKSVSCNTSVDMHLKSSLTLVIIWLRTRWHIENGRTDGLMKVLLTEKNLLKSFAMLEKASRLLSSCGRQQHRSRSRHSHTLVATERAVDRNWERSLLCRFRTPSGSTSPGCGRGSPSGSNTKSTPNAVNSRMIQLQRRKKMGQSTSLNC